MSYLKARFVYCEKRREPRRRLRILHAAVNCASLKLSEEFEKPEEGPHTSKIVSQRTNLLNVTSVDLFLKPVPS